MTADPFVISDQEVKANGAMVYITLTMAINFSLAADKGRPAIVCESVSKYTASDSNLAN
jgi:hypothetical protein